MIPADELNRLYGVYGKEKVDEALAYLSYHKPDELPKTEIEGKPTMYVFRHGQSVDNANFVFSGWRLAPITKQGEEQALTLAKKLRDKKIDLLISSPQKRAMQTMQIAMSLNETAKNLEINTDKRIKERHYGDLQGQSKLEYHLKDPEGLLKIRRTFDGMPPNGESIGMVYDRVSSFCDEIIPLMQENNINVAVSCHGNSIRCFRKYFEGLSDEAAAAVETMLGQDYAAYSV